MESRVDIQCLVIFSSYTHAKLSYDTLTGQLHFARDKTGGQGSLRGHLWCPPNLALEGVPSCPPRWTGRRPLRYDRIYFEHAPRVWTCACKVQVRSLAYGMMVSRIADTLLKKGAKTLTYGWHDRSHMFVTLICALREGFTWTWMLTMLLSFLY